MLQQQQFGVVRSWPQWMQSAATILTGTFQQPRNQARGSLGGEIYYVSPPLRSLTKGNRIIELPTSIRERANQIIESEEVLKEYGSRAVEQMWTIRPSRVQQIVDRTERDLEESTRDWFDEEFFDEKDQYGWDDMADEKQAAATAQNQIRLLSIISELVRNCQVHNDAVIFFEEGGIVGLAPVGTRVGDIVCRIEELNTVGILREHGEDLWMIAKAMQLSSLAEGNRSCTDVVFDVDVEHMRVLTRS
ncbi:hypothetical protein N431DRAFT_431070 [Stipitochalara longipes BDJ]|nr:hypothetical protein N431DRAFT_431070 [Stipitochalara longipes BDJ]